MHEAVSAFESPAATGTAACADDKTSVRDGILCSLVVGVCILVVHGNSNAPFMDDFSYAKSALDFARTGHFVYNGWASAMLGWLVPWGAIFIKLFGFSFRAVQLSMLPLAMACVYLFHQILRRFGIAPANAVLGALTLAFSPLFLPLAASFMTDVPGLLVILVCIWMCQRAVAAMMDRVALAWLCGAAVVNIAGGTVRQIAWLGALVMVPSTAWLLRQRRGMKVAGLVLFLCSFFGVLACLHWFYRQPYSLPEQILPEAAHPRILVHLAAQLLKTFLCVLLVVLPVCVTWLPVARCMRSRARWGIAGAMVLLAAIAGVLYVKGTVQNWTMPWLTPLIAAQKSLLPGLFGAKAASVTLWAGVAISLLAIAMALIVAGHAIGRNWKELDSNGGERSSWIQAGWIMGPFTLSYFLLLIPRAVNSYIQDRYLLGLAPAAIVFLLLLYQDRVGAKRSSIGFVVLGFFALYSIAGAHALFQRSRVVENAVQMVENSGVPRTAIQAGLASDGWVQVETDGYLDDPRIKVPAGAYHPNLYELRIPGQCRYEFAKLMPAIAPKYFIVSGPLSCFARTAYPPVHYTSWLPPFHRALYVQQLKNEEK